MPSPTHCRRWHIDPDNTPEAEPAWSGWTPDSTREISGTSTDSSVEQGQSQNWQACTRTVTNHVEPPESVPIDRLSMTGKSAGNDPEARPESVRKAGSLTEAPYHRFADGMLESAARSSTTRATTVGKGSTSAAAVERTSDLLAFLKA